VVTTRAGQAGIPGERRVHKIKYQYVPRPIEMMKSPAYRVLSLSARRVLDRIEIELANHAGHDNAKLAVTHEHFAEYGVHHNAVAPAQRELDALGIAVIAEHGVAGNAADRAPNLFRLTYRPSGRALPTNEWRRIKTMEEAMMIAQTARTNLRKNYRVKKQKPSTGSCVVSLPKKGVQTGKNGPAAPKVVPPKPVVPLYSHEGTPETALPALCSLPTAGGPKSAQRRRKLPWSTPVLTEVTDPTEVEAIRRAAVAATADPKCAKCQPAPFLIHRNGRLVSTHRLAG
jgi:hypothetical protein